MHFLFRTYCLPGRIIAHLWYLWPKKGQIWASKRRKESTFVHFFYSSVVYLIAIPIIVSAANR